MKKSKTKKRILKKKNKSGFTQYLKNQLLIFIDSFKKINLNYSFVVLYDLLFYLIAFLLTYLSGFILGKVSPIDFSVELTMNNVLPEYVNAFLVYFLIITIIIIFLAIFAFAISRLLIWNYITKKKMFDLNGVGKFYLLNLLLLVGMILILFIPTALFMRYIKLNNPLALISLVLFPLIVIFVFYLAILIIIHFVRQKKKGIFTAIKTGFVFGITKIKYFLIPVLFSIIFYFVLGLIMNFASYLPQVVGMVLSIAVFLLSLAWLRYYLIDIVEKVQANKI